MMIMRQQIGAVRIVAALTTFQFACRRASEDFLLRAPDYHQISKPALAEKDKKHMAHALLLWKAW